MHIFLVFSFWFPAAAAAAARKFIALSSWPRNNFHFWDLLTFTFPPAAATATLFACSLAIFFSPCFGLIFN